MGEPLLRDRRARAGDAPRPRGCSELFLFGAFTAGLLVSGFFAPLAGRLIDQRGGRFVLSVGSVLAVVACAMLALAPNAPVMVAGWLVAGASMAACLYDPAFATLSQHTGAKYRKAVTALTLFGGFASTVFWPLSHILQEAWGWRMTWGIYAGVHLFVCLPIHQFFIPRHSHLTRGCGYGCPCACGRGLAGDGRPAALLARDELRDCRPSSWR